MIQVFAEKPDSAVDRPVRWLVGFATVRLGPGDSTTTRVSARGLAHWESGWRTEVGPCLLHVGKSAVDLPTALKVEVHQVKS